MEGYCGPAPVGVAKLLVRTFLSDFVKSKVLKNGDDLSWLEDRGFCHELAYNNVLRADKLPL